MSHYRWPVVYKAEGMDFTPETTLRDEQIQSGLRSVIKDGIAVQAMGTLTGGVFLVAFALKLGAPNFVIGLLAAINPLAQFVQLPAIVLVEKLRKRKAITLITASLNRLCWLAIALIPLFLPEANGLHLLLAFIVMASVFGAISGCSWNSWMRDLVPQEILGSFFSKRMRLAVAFGIILSLGAAGYLDLWQKFLSRYEIWGYSTLFLFGFCAGVLGLLFKASVPEPRMAAGDDGSKLLNILIQPFKDTNFRKLIIFLFSWNFSVNLAGPFFMVYMLKWLGLSMSLIIALSVVSQIMNFASLNIWGKFADRFSNKSVLAISGPLFIFSILAWTFTTIHEKYALTLLLLVMIHIVMGLSWAGVSLASGNISLKLAPKGQATAYLATNTIMNSIAAGTAPVLGGKFVDFFKGRKLSWTPRYTSPTGEFILPTLNLRQWDFLFVLAFLIGLYSLHRLAKVKEVGEVEEEIVVRELLSEVKRQIRSFPPIEGLRQMISFPLGIILNLFGEKRK